MAAGLSSPPEILPNHIYDNEPNKLSYRIAEQYHESCSAWFLHINELRLHQSFRYSPVIACLLLLSSDLTIHIAPDSVLGIPQVIE